MPPLLDFTRFPLGANLAAFALGAAIVWLAGTLLARYADGIAAKTGFGQAIIGFLLLAWIGSLPELAVSVTSAASGNAPLAVNNLIGGVAMQVTILALADVAIGRRALSAELDTPIVMLQGSLKVLMLSIVAAGTVVAEASLCGIGVWSWSLLAGYVVSVALIWRSRKRSHHWVPRDDDEVERERRARRKIRESEDEPSSLGSLAGKTVLAAGAILVAGVVLSRTGEALGEQTGLGSSFVGAVLLAISTSLPELSIAVSAARLGRYELAISDIFGANIYDIAMIFVIDAVYLRGSVLGSVGPFSTFASLLAIVLTTTFLTGIIMRRTRTVARMGIDSLVVLGVYLAGLVVLYQLR